MNLFGWELSLSRKAGTVTIDQLMRRLEAAHETLSGIEVTPETAMRSPTVNAIVTGVSRRMAALPVHVLRTTDVKGRIQKERLPSHPVERLLNRPNDWQSRVSYWLDATSWLMRHGNYYAFKGRGVTGPIRRLEPLHPGAVTVEQDEALNVTFRVARSGGAFGEYQPSDIHHVRGPARNGLVGDSPIMDVREAIALEIAAERFGASFFGNGAMPSLVFKHATGFTSSPEQRLQFISDFHASYSKKGRFKALLLPDGIDLADPINLDNDRAQFLETRKLQRSIIAGALGMPPHMAGDLERATFTNIEHQSLDFVQGVVLPYARIFEAAMERDLLTAEDRAGGVIIRFNLDGALRGDFKSRQEGLAIQRQNGVINANDWREHEGMNPIGPDDGGDEYWRQGPSGQSAEATETTETTNDPEA